MMENQVDDIADVLRQALAYVGEDIEGMGGCGEEAGVEGNSRLEQAMALSDALLAAIRRAVILNAPGVKHDPL